VCRALKHIGGFIVGPRKIREILRECHVLAGLPCGKPGRLPALHTRDNLTTRMTWTYNKAYL
jgi:hypothetical protein